MTTQLGILDEVNRVVNSYLTEQNLIFEKLHNIQSKRNEIATSNNILIPLNLETGHDFIKTKTAAFKRNKTLRAEFNSSAGKLRSKRCYNPAEDNLYKMIDLYSEILSRTDIEGITYIEDIRFTRPRKGPKPYRRSDTGRFWCSSFRLNNNNLVTISGISDMVQQVFEIPENLTWLDLSFNKLTYIDPEISLLRNLKILYLHGNLFSEFKLVLPELRNLEYLYSLTLHGNPIEEDKCYRQKILCEMPRLKNLDFTNVTNSDLISTDLYCLSRHDEANFDTVSKKKSNERGSY